MKIFYTKKFKEVIKKPYKQIELGKYKIRKGTETGFEKLTSENVMSEDFISEASPTSMTEERFYESQFVNYSGSLQISLELPETDASIYEKNFYQVFLFYYTDLSTVETSLAFLVFNDFRNGIFSGLELTSRKNIITTPQFSWECNFKFNQSDYTELLENVWGQDIAGVTPLGKDKVYNKNPEYISVESWRKFWIDKVSEEGEQDWIETIYMNNFGLKIY